MSTLTPFFKTRGWRPFPFQKETWQAYRDGKSGLLHAPTGLGKTLAVWLGPVAEAIETKNTKGCRVLWITPLRALALDTWKSLHEPLNDLKLKIEIGIRTGDTTPYQKAKQKKKLPFCLITTPESLSLLLTHENFQENLSGLTAIVVDEWHELIGTKRGVQTELCLARLRQWFPNLRIWGLSATLGNTEEAKEVLLGSTAKDAAIISGARVKKVHLKTLLPKNIDRFPWSGHIGTQLVPQVVKILSANETTLLFTNTRSQTEIWFQELLEYRPEWKDELAMHHGSLDQEERKLVEERLREGNIRCVVCTSSLDLGVDFSPVSQVIQVGSPKGIARLMQRAGRSGHRPGGVSKLYCVPGNALELVEFAAARDAIAEKEIEARFPLQKPLDVLVQHLVTVCIGEPTSAADLRREVSSSYAYRNLSDQEWQWALEFITRGGQALASYPGFKKVTSVKGKLTVGDKKLIQLHRLSIGTITSYPTITLAYQSGGRLGSVEESFITRIKPGSVFIFGGKRLELVRFRNQKATVRNATKKARGEIPVWAGSRMPLSNELSHAVARRLKSGKIDTPEMKLISPVLDIQRAWSHIPHDEMILIEQVEIRREIHLFIYTFAGRLVNEGLGSLVAWRISQREDLLIQVTMNDYGFSLTSTAALPFETDLWRELLDVKNLLEDLVSCMNTAELARRQFREIARVSGLVLQQLPKRKGTPRAVQTSAKLLYEVFERYDPENLLLAQARREILDNQLEFTRLKKTMEDLATRPLNLQHCERLTPMAFPLWADRLQAHHQGADSATRLEKMLTSLETAAGQSSC
ncbi:ligase-associated DNA damage response DEXH box helicase [Verrucomicrobiaceae bacterium 227]